MFVSGFAIYFRFFLNYFFADFVLTGGGKRGACACNRTHVCVSGEQKIFGVLCNCCFNLYLGFGFFASFDEYEAH